MKRVSSSTGWRGPCGSCVQHQVRGGVFPDRGDFCPLVCKVGDSKGRRGDALWRRGASSEFVCSSEVVIVIL